MHPVSSDSLPSGLPSEDSQSGMTIIAQGLSYQHGYKPEKVLIFPFSWGACYNLQVDSGCIISLA